MPSSTCNVISQKYNLNLSSFLDLIASLQEIQEAKEQDKRHVIRNKFRMWYIVEENCIAGIPWQPSGESSALIAEGEHSVLSSVGELRSYKLGGVAKTTTTKKHHCTGFFKDDEKEKGVIIIVDAG